MQTRRVTALIAVMLTTAGGAAADELPTVPRVRVTSAALPSGRVVGRLVGLDAETLTIRGSGRAERPPPEA